MVRKQIYLEEQQERWLKRLSKAQGISEAELIRRGLVRSLGSGFEVARNPAAWAEAKAVIRRLMAMGPVKRTGRWRRDELYDRKVSG